MILGRSDFEFVRDIWGVCVSIWGGGRGGEGGGRVLHKGFVEPREVGGGALQIIKLQKGDHHAASSSNNNSRSRNSPMGAS